MNQPVNQGLNLAAHHSIGQEAAANRVTTAQQREIASIVSEVKHALSGSTANRAELDGAMFRLEQLSQGSTDAIALQNEVNDQMAQIDLNNEQRRMFGEELANMPSTDTMLRNARKAFETALSNFAREVAPNSAAAQDIINRGSVGIGSATANQLNTNAAHLNAKATEGPRIGEFSAASALPITPNTTQHLHADVPQLPPRDDT
jgi:hypothetical protein